MQSRDRGEPQNQGKGLGKLYFLKESIGFGTGKYGLILVSSLNNGHLLVITLLLCSKKIIIIMPTLVGFPLGLKHHLRAVYEVRSQCSVVIPFSFLAFLSLFFFCPFSPNSLFSLFNNLTLKIYSALGLWKVQGKQTEKDRILILTFLTASRYLDT